LISISKIESGESEEGLKEEVLGGEVVGRDVEGHDESFLTCMEFGEEGISSDSKIYN